MDNVDINVVIVFSVVCIIAFVIGYYTGYNDALKRAEATLDDARKYVNALRAIYGRREREEP